MKKASRKSKLIVGAFVVGMSAMIIVAILLLDDNLSFFKHSSRYFAAFKNTSGLHSGAPVKMGGVDIGSVESIAISTQGDAPQILLTLVVYAPHNNLIKSDSEATLETQGMLGDKVVNISGGSPGADKMPPASFLKTKEVAGIATVVTQSTDIIKTVGNTTQKIDAFVDTLPNAKVMKSISEDLLASAEQFKSVVSALNANESTVSMLADPATARQFKQTLNDLQSASAHFSSVAEKIDNGKGTVGALVNDPALYDDIRKLLGRANRSKTAKYIIDKVLDEPEK